MTISAVVFDVDGVLVRAGRFADILASDHGLDRDRTKDFFMGPFKECVLGRADMRDEIAPFLGSWGWPGSVDDLVELWFEADSEVIGDVLDVVPRLRAAGWPCFVASTQERHRAAYLERVLGFADAFDDLFFSCHVGVSKPDPAFFAHVVERTGRPGTELLFFDDHPPNVDAARACGWTAELFADGDDIVAMLARHDVRT